MLPFALGGANSAVLTAATAALDLGWVALALATLPSDRRLVARMAPVALPACLLLGWTALPFVPGIAPDLIARPAAPDLLALGWCHAFSLVALLVGCATAGRVPGFAYATATWLCVFAGVLIAVTLGLRAFGDPAMMQRVIVDHRYHRFAGLMGNANAAGIGYGMMSLLLHGIARDRWRAWRTQPHGHIPIAATIAALGSVIALSLVALSQSRTALAATVVAQLAYAVGFPALPRAGRGWLPAVALLALAVVLGLSSGSALSRYGALGDDGSGRLSVLRHYADLARTAPLSGYGLGGFDAVNQRHLTPETVLLVGDFGAAHNAILQLAIEAGWPGVVLLLLTLAALVVRVARTTTIGSDRSNAIARAMLFAVAVAVVGSMVDIALNVPAIAALSAALLGIVWGRTLRDDPRRRPPRAPHLAPWPIAAIRS
ncbi:O-antigen ligase [Sphingomonas sp. PvP055]|uniref:O-antigen ligase family protein n=1 Tax=Sphingomonas sp. PvP055 TaxID=3156391 RepID=UPI0033918D47